MSTEEPKDKDNSIRLTNKDISYGENDANLQKGDSGDTGQGTDANIVQDEKIHHDHKKNSGNENDNSDLNNTEDDLIEDVITSKFHFVDLAGSERLKKVSAANASDNTMMRIRIAAYENVRIDNVLCMQTKAEGERLKEGININSGYPLIMAMFFWKTRCFYIQ